jgi:hypothetical protein
MKQPWWALLIVVVFGVGAGMGAAALFGGDSDSADGSISMGSTETSVPPETTTASTTTVAPTTTTTAPPTTTTTTTTSTVAPTTTEPVQPPLEQVQIVVTNGSGIGGIAGTTAQLLRDVGYPNVELADGQVLSPVTVIYVADGLEPTATRLAADLRVIDPGSVEPIVAPLAEALPIAPAFPDADIILFLGQDQA